MIKFNPKIELKKNVDELVLYVGSSLEGDDEEHFNSYFEAMEHLIKELPQSDYSKKEQKQIIEYIDTITIKEMKKVIAPMTIKKLYKKIYPK